MSWWLLRGFSLTWFSYEGEALASSWQHQFFEVLDLVFIKIEYNPIASMYHEVHLTLHIERALKMPTASALSTIISPFTQLSGHSSTTKNILYPREGRAPSQLSLALSTALRSLLFWATCSGPPGLYPKQRSPSIVLFCCAQPQVTSTSRTLESNIVHSRNWTPWGLFVQG